MAMRERQLDLFRPPHVAANRIVSERDGRTYQPCMFCGAELVGAVTGTGIRLQTFAEGECVGVDCPRQDKKGHKPMKHLIAVLLLLLPSVVSAQTLRELSRQPVAFQQTTTTVVIRVSQEHADLDALNHATWFYVGTAAADWSVTAVCARVTCSDDGHTQAGLFLHGVEPRWSIPLGLAIDAGLVYAIRAFIAPDNPKLARVLLYGFGGARVVFVTTKVTDLRHHAVRQ